MNATGENKAIPFRRFVSLLSIITIGICGVVFLYGAESSVTSAIAQPNKLNLSMSEFATGLNSPVGITNAGRDDDRLFVIERAGLIKVFHRDGTILPAPFLDIVDRVESSFKEEGLLGLVFHPNYANNGYFYVNYTNTTNGVTRTHISRFTVTADANIADPSSEDILLTVTQPFEFHNAGDLHFGPDGYLYIPFGDGDDHGDPNDHAQNIGLLLGKIVRIDVDLGSPKAPDCKGEGSGNYSIPLTNPLADGAGGTCDEIWASGLRNPWRSSFDRLTGDFYISDVGQSSSEEINFQPAGSSGGENYGWRCYEGNHGHNLTGCGPKGDYTFPIFEYSHGGTPHSCSIIGGYVYRGAKYPDMQGRYLMTDWCSGLFWDIVHDGNDWLATQHTNLSAFGYVSFGEDSDSELYIVNNANGKIFRLELEGKFYMPIIMQN